MFRELKFLFTDFYDFFKKDFKLAPYLYTLIIIALSITFVYTSETGKLFGNGSLPFKNKFINNILLFGILYYLVCIPTLMMQKQKNLINAKFIFKSAFLIIVLASIDVFSWGKYIEFANFEPLERNYLKKVLWWSKNFMFFLPIIVILRLFFDKKIPGLYGLCRGNHHIKAYLWLYVIVIPILIAVAFTPSFLSYYPMGKIWQFHDLFGNSTVFNYILFEFIYISSFIMVELIFRGVFVIGMKNHILNYCVLPMITIYVALHFGKPLLETISAAFGGYFLGAIAFQSKHIWGGVFVHAGIAFTIEFVRLLQYLILGI